MDFLRFLEGLRIPVLNEVMLAITYLGDEVAFLAIALVLFWCVDKRHGYYIMSVGFLGTITTQFMKLMCRIPRPWVQDKNFTILEQAREGAGGYSFPSGHSQSSVGTFGSLAVIADRKWIRWLAVAVAVLVPFSRMYVGVHTPADVLVGSAVALALVFAVRPIIYNNDGKYFPWLIGFMVLIAVGYLCYVECYPFPADIDLHNLESGTSNAYTLLGALLGLIPVYIVDKKWLQFPTKAVWWVQIIKTVVGLAIVLVLKSLLKDTLNVLFGELPGRAVRYFLIVLFGGIAWPMTFKHLAKLDGNSVREFFLAMARIFKRICKLDNEE